MQHLHDIFKDYTKFGEKQSYDGMTVFPILAVKQSPVRYLNLKQALSMNLITITEVSEGGSVPNLKVINQADLPVLLLDGEEIAGAKQNRILNATVLVREKSETIIPVSCTERGRWSYNNSHFEESGNVINAKIRSQKMQDVTSFMKVDGSFKSDQGKIWSEIDKMADCLVVRSDTDALADVYQATHGSLEDYIAYFPCGQNQVGIAVCIEDKVVGLDCLSSPEIWKDMHEKLIKSYAIDCLNINLKAADCNIGTVHDFLHKFTQCLPQIFPSVGYGEDYRFESPELIGSCLFWQESIIHLALYARTKQEYDTPYHSPRSRYQRI
jgi:hypothetical protein